MSNGNKTKITVTLIAIFAAGAIAGGFFVSAFSERSRPPTLGNLTERQMNRIARELELTDDQIARIMPIVEDISEEIRSVRHKSMSDFIRLYNDMEKRVTAELTPEQAEIFGERQELRRRRAEEMLKRRMDGERRGPGRMDGTGPPHGPPPDRPPPLDGTQDEPPPDAEEP